MRAVLFAVFSLFAFADEVGAAGLVPQDDARHIQVEVNLRDVRGKPLTEVPLVIHDGQAARVEGVTNEHGSVTLEAALPLGIERIEIRSGFADESSFSGAQQLALVRKMYEWVFDYTAEPCIVELVPEKDVYQVDFVYLDAVSVRGIVTGPNDEPIGHSVIGPRAVLGDASGRRQFQVRGIRKGAPTTLLATSWLEDVPLAILVPVTLTAEQTQEGVDLGRIVIPDVHRDASVDVALSNVGAVLGPVAGVTFVKMDGSILFAVRAYDRRHAQAGEVWGNPVQLPAGKYIVIAGNAAMVPSEELWTLLAAIREGRDVEDLELRTITLDPEHEQRVTFDLAELQEQSRRALEP